MNHLDHRRARYQRRWRNPAGPRPWHPGHGAWLWAQRISVIVAVGVVLAAVVMGGWMTEEELKAIEARLQAATPGPWSDFCESGDWWIETMADDGSPGGLVVCDANDMDAADMALIAAAPTDIAALIAEVRRLRALMANTNVSMPKGLR